MSFIRILFILVIGPAVLGCSTPKTQLALTPLPLKWSAQVIAMSPGFSCQAIQALNESHFFQLCSTKNSHGVVKFFNRDILQVSEFELPSRDPLALSSSVSEESAWAQDEKNLYVGTMDGRVLKFNFKGEHLGTHLLEMPTWVQHLKWKNGHLYVVASRHERVRILKLNQKLLPQNSYDLTHRESEAQWTFANGSFFVTTHKGTIYQLSKDLELSNLWKFKEHLEMGKPLVVKNSLWVGDSEGSVYKINSNRIQVQKLGKGPISSALIRTQHGLWVAFDEEGILRLVDMNMKLKRVIKLPITRSFTGFESLSFQGHTLLKTSTQGIVTLLNSQGEILSSIEGEESQVEFMPETEDTLAQERLPASFN